MLLHQGLGLEAFNEMPLQKAVHAVFECCSSVPLAGDLVRGRPYDDYDALFRLADGLLFGLSENSIDSILQAYPHIGRRPRSARSHAEQCALWDESVEVMAQLDGAAKRYLDNFGFSFVMFVNGYTAQDVVDTIADRMLNDVDTERKVVRNQLAKINRTRLDRMLGPEGGYHNW